MTAEVKHYLVRCDKSTAEFLVTEIKKMTGSPPRQSEIKGIGGGTELILFGTAALGVLKSILDLIKECIETNRSIKGIKVEEHEVNDPKKADVINLQKQVGNSN